MATSQLYPAVPTPRGTKRSDSSRVAATEALAPRSAALRLTRRGRVVLRLLAGVAFLLAVAVAVLLLGRPAVAGTEVRPVPVRHHVVLPGETLLEIAAEVDPEADARDTAVRIARLNALESWGLQAGQQLALPVEP